MRSDQGLSRDSRLRHRRRLFEAIAVLLLLTGEWPPAMPGRFRPIMLGWLAGALMLWASPRWERRHKVIGTLAWPGTLVLLLCLIIAVPLAFSSPDPGDQPAMLPAVQFGLIGVVAVVQLAVAVWLVCGARMPEVPLPPPASSGVSGRPGPAE